MKGQSSGLLSADSTGVDRVPDGIFLVRVARTQFKKYYPKPYNIVKRGRPRTVAVDNSCEQDDMHCLSP